MKIKNTILALVVVAALGGVFYYLNRLPEKPGKNDIPKENLFSFTPDQVEEFTLEEAAKPVAVIRRLAATPAPAPSKPDAITASKPGEVNKDAAPQWEITAPEGVASDSTQIQSFIEEVAVLQGSPLQTDAAPNWAEYGLDAPEKTYRFKLKDGKTVEFAIGMQNPAGYARYARRNNAAPILLIDEIDDKALVERTLFDLRDKRVLPASLEEARRIELHFDLSRLETSPEELAKAKQLGLPVKPPRIVMTKQANGNWDLDEPRLRTDHGATNYLYTSLSGGSMRSLEEEKAASLGKYGLDRPQIRADVTTPAGAVSLLVGKDFKQGEEQLFYAKNSVWPHVFTLLRTVYDQLNQDLEAYRERYLFDFDQNNARSLEIQAPAGQFRFGRRGEDWFMAGSPEKKIEDVKMSNYLNSVHSLRISTYTTDEPNRFAAYGLDKPWMKIKVTFGEKNQEETIFYARKDKKFYAARQGEPSVYELSPNEPDNLEAKLKELTEPPVPEPPPAPSNPAPAK